jgi:hypothetical protein
VGFSKTHYFISTNIAYIWFFLSGTPKYLHTKEDYLTSDMLQRRLQYSYVTRWLATNGEVEEGVLSEGSHSARGSFEI